MSRYDRDCQRILLPAPKFCGRGVEIVELTPSEKDDALKRAAHCMDGGMEPGAKPDVGTQTEWTLHNSKEGVCAMIVGVTKKAGFKTIEQIADPAVEWQRVSPVELTDENSPMFFDRLFPTAKDDGLLWSVFSELHNVTQEEVQDILGKSMPVTR